jgi:hypothetical protein
MGPSSPFYLGLVKLSLRQLSAYPLAEQPSGTIRVLFWVLDYSTIPYRLLS